MENIIYFSSDEWDSGLKTSQYHIAVRLARDNKVLYINSIGLRKPTASVADAMRIISKVKRCLQGVRKINTNLYVFTPLVIPFHHWKLIQRINRFILKAFLKHLRKKLKLDNPIVFTFLPNVTNIIKALGEKRIVYYCADQVAMFKGVNKETTDALEKELLRIASVVFITSRRLYDEKKRFNKNTHYMPHGVDAELFSQALLEETVIPIDIGTLQKPVIGFFGLISRDWIDFDLLRYIALARPGWSVALIGRSAQDIPDLSSYKNIIFLGSKDYTALPAYAKAFDAAIIPFVISELTTNANPVKTKEYLAAGKPVVATKIPELEHYRPWVSIADNYEQFVSQIESALKNDCDILKRQRSEAVKDDSWDERFNKISEIIRRSR